MCRYEEVCLLGGKKKLIALEQTWILLVNTLSMSEETFSVKMGCVSALCVNNSGKG